MFIDVRVFLLAVVANSQENGREDFEGEPAVVQGDITPHAHCDVFMC